MILKEKQLANSQNPRIMAGDETEKQMAFYLNRAFGKEKDCFVLNDLRIVHDDNVAQIDHLIVTKYGLFIIESKSVHGKIIINKHNEWSRTYNNATEGMRSPVLQAEAQGKILKSLLIDNKEKLLSKILGTLQKGFGYCPINVYVAISDNGLIERKTSIPELFKADQITSAIEKELIAAKKLASILSLSMDTGWSINADETRNVAQFLLSKHEPLTNKTETSIEKAPELTTTVMPIEEKSKDKSFVPKVGAICPVCKKHKLIRKSIKRSDNTETDFLACEVYPTECKAIYALVAVAKSVISTIHTEEIKYKANDNCPKCKTGKLVNRKAKTEFLGCSQYPKCKFTDYK